MTTEIEPRESIVDPWAELDRAFDVMRRGFAESFGISPFGAFEELGTVRAPKTDVTDTGASYKLVAEFPGIPKEKLDIRIRGSTVELRAESAKETEESTGQYLRRERAYSGFYRAIELPDPVLASGAKAQLVDGVLVLELPKQTPTPSAEEVKVPVA